MNLNENNWVFNKWLWLGILFIAANVACSMWLFEDTVTGAICGLFWFAIVYVLMPEGLIFTWRSFWQMEKQEDE
jgi:hypothetical protein